MSSIKTYFEIYGESHQNFINKLIHWFCVPLIFFSIIWLTYFIKLTFLSSLIPNYLCNLAFIIILFGVMFYLYYSIQIAIGMFLFSVLNYYIIYSISNVNFEILPVLIFIFSWIFQLIGHKIEGKKPSFLEDIFFLMIGPAWLLSFIYDKIGIKY